MSKLRPSRWFALLVALAGYACSGSRPPQPHSTAAETHSAILPAASDVAARRARDDRALAARLHGIVLSDAGRATPREGYLVLSFRNENLFRTGRIDLSVEGEDLLRRLAPMVRALQAADAERPSAYTSGPTLIHGYPSDWPLSLARAGGVAQFLGDCDVPAASAAPPSAAATRPDAPLPARRVDVLVPASQQFQGVYFEPAKGS